MQARTKLITSIAAIVAVFVAASAAQASVVAFENPPGPGHFDWNASDGHAYLDLTLSAASQAGVSSAPSSFWVQQLPSTSGGTTTRIVGTVSTSRLERIGRDVSPTEGISFLSNLDVDTPIPTPTGPDVSGFSTLASLYYPDSEPGYPNSEFQEGEPGYLGVRFNLGSGLQYGWIGIIRTGTEVDAFAWGYETEPGVEILAGAGIPEPASLSLLLIGVIRLYSRRGEPGGRGRRR